MEFDFNQNVVVDDLAKVPEQFRGVYVENTEGEDGGYTINPSLKSVTDAVSGLNSALTKARKEAKGRKSVTPKDVLEPLGFESVESAQEAFNTLKEQVEAASEGKINLDKMKADMQRNLDKAIEAKDMELKGMSASLQRYLVEKEAVNAITKAKGVSDLLLPHIKQQAKVIKDGDDFVVRIVDADGEARGDGKGGFMTVDNLVAELKGHATFGRAFESDAPRGSGAPPAGARPPQAPGTQQRELSSTEKIAQGLRNRK